MQKHGKHGHDTKLLYNEWLRNLSCDEVAKVDVILIFVAG